MSKNSIHNFIPRPVQEFLETESASGWVMIVCAILAMVAANSPFAGLYHDIIEAPISFSFHETTISEPIKHWVKDVLMVFFFLVVGLELKREMLEGFLSKKEQIILPMVAAICGMAIPALVFLLFNHNSPATIGGWAIPSATDIAFALAILTMFGRGIPPSIKILLLAIAIFDDLGAIIVIVAFYSHDFALQPLLLAVFGVAGLALLNKLQVEKIMPYILIGAYLWFCFYAAGVHTTLAGVIVGFSIPIRVEKDAQKISPLNTCLHFLHPWVSFLILPIFAFTSAGVELSGIDSEMLFSPLPLGIALGLLLGKPIGIFGSSFALIKSGWVTMPEGANLRDIFAISILAGIGFTMSLFIGMLAFSDDSLHEMVKIGVIAGSTICISLGALVLKTGKRPTK